MTNDTNITDLDSKREIAHKDEVLEGHLNKLL